MPQQSLAVGPTEITNARFIAAALLISLDYDAKNCQFSDQGD